MTRRLRVSLLALGTLPATAAAVLFLSAGRYALALLAAVPVAWTLAVWSTSAVARPRV